MEGSSRIDRKTIEKNRRNQMKDLYSKLHSLVPRYTSREAMSLPDQLGEAANYIKKLEKELEEMKKKKDRLISNKASVVGLRSPQIEIHEMGSALEVVLVTGLDFQFLFNELIRMLHEEGAEVVQASFSVVDDTVFHTIHSELGKSGPECGAAMISERLKKFVFDAGSF